MDATGTRLSTSDARRRSHLTAASHNPFEEELPAFVDGDIFADVQGGDGYTASGFESFAEGRGSSLRTSGQTPQQDADLGGEGVDTEQQHLEEEANYDNMGGGDYMDQPEPTAAAGVGGAGGAGGGKAAGRAARRPNKRNRVVVSCFTICHSLHNAN